MTIQAGPVLTFWNMIGSMGVRTVRKREFADHADDVDVHHSGARFKKLALDDLAHRILWRFEAELSRRIGVQHHVDAALRRAAFLVLVQGDIERHVVGRPVRVEPAAGNQLQAHGFEIAGADIILSDVHLLVAPGRDEPGIAAVVGRDANVGQARPRRRQECASSAPGSSPSCEQLVAIEVLDLQDVVALVAGIDRSARRRSGRRPRRCR